jgi:hypothetical protein
MYGGGSSAPPPPPDYTAEKAAEIKRITGDYKTQAQTYNDAVKSFKDSFAGYGIDNSSTPGGSSFMANINQANKLGMRDLYDDPNTSANEDRSSTYGPNIEFALGTLRGMSFDTPAPKFTSSVETPYGPVTITDIPNLLDVGNYERRLNTLIGQGESALSNLGTLRTDRQAEVDRVMETFGGYGSKAREYESGIGRLGIADQSAIDQYQRDLDRLKETGKSFRSPIMDQINPDYLQEIDDYLEPGYTALSNLRTEREKEQKRISDFSTGILGLADTGATDLAGLNISKLDEINQLQKLIDDKQRDAGRFSSELGFNFNSPLAELAELERGVGGLLTDRRNEETRITRAQQDALNRSRALEGQVGTTDIYSRAGLDALQSQIDDLQGEVTNFSSLLPFDFGNVNTALTTAEGSLGDLYGERKKALDDIVSGVSTANAGLGDIPLYDESAIRGRLSDAREQEGLLARFSGGRVNDIQGQITSATEAINARLGELTEYRKGLEEQAQALLTKVRERSFYSLDDLTGQQPEIDAAQAEIELYNAQQALDEIDAITTRLNSEKGRLERDAENVLARQRVEQAELAASLGPGGVPQFQDYGLIDPITASDYSRLLLQNADEEEEDLLNLPSQANFSRNLGVIRV